MLAVAKPIAHSGCFRVLLVLLVFLVLLVLVFLIFLVLLVLLVSLILHNTVEAHSELQTQVLVRSRYHHRE